VDRTGQTLLGKYEIEGLLGQGGMGAVWHARHTLTGREVAIKILDQSYLNNSQVTRRFLREARAASAVEHPGIVEVLDIDETDEGLPFIVMELLGGETLARRIERRGRLKQDELLRLGVLLLEALEAAHAQGVIHRDLKPENVHVVPAGRRGEIVKILDFGISHMAEPHEQKLTMTGSVLGTPHYMSPEQAMGETEIDHRADLYAAGVVLYEMAVGDVPFDAPNYNKLLRRILDEEPPTPTARGAELTEPVERVILWGMEKERDRRVGSAREMVSWLKRAAAGEPVPYERLAPKLARPLSGEVSIDVDLDDEPDTAGASWEVGEDLIAGIVDSPPRSKEIDIPSAAKRAPPAELELDEEALRPSPRRPRTSSSGSIPAPVGTASSSGQHVAIPASAPVPRTTPASEPPPPTSGINPIPRVAQMSGAYAPVEATEPERPAWVKWVVVGIGAVAIFVGLVFLVRFVVDPGPAPPPPTPVTDPDVDPSEEDPDEPRWVSITVVGLPPGSRLMLDGLPASTPMRLRRGSEHVLEITAQGYEDRRIELTAERNRTINARLRPAIGTVQGEH